MTLDPTRPETSLKPAAQRPGALDLMLLSVACGLAAGELEVAARVARRSLSTTDQLYLMTRHFVWLVPVVNLAVFVFFGGVLALLMFARPRLGGWLGPRLLVGFLWLPMLLAAGRGVYPEAWLLLSLGIASWLAPVIMGRWAIIRARLPWGLAVLAALVSIQGGSILLGDWRKQRQEDARPLPAAGAPNVLLIVLDTVRADHLSLYGYERPTSPNLDRLAQRGVRFDQARSAAPWTLASHATLFTSRWPHELGVQWMRPIPGSATTLAEFLGRQGYATAGFVGNTFYCSYDSGLDRGFTHYQDHVLDTAGAIRSAALVELTLKSLANFAPLLPAARFEVIKLAAGERKGAHVVNRELLDWLTRRKEPRRPFFAFLNYVDAHAPYVLPPGVGSPFGPGPQSEADVLFLAEGWQALDKTRLPPQALAFARDSYDNCLAFLDGQLGALIENLERRGILDQTLLVVTADHGEGLGEHDLFDHGESLYRTEIRVPLVIVPPKGRGQAPVAVRRFVSLREIPATIAELARPGEAHPFSGESLSRFWNGPGERESESSIPSPVLSELVSPNPLNPNQGRSPASRGPLAALAEGDLVYIRSQGDGREQLFDQNDDPRELSSRAQSPDWRPMLEKFRALLSRIQP